MDAMHVPSHRAGSRSSSTTPPMVGPPPLYILIMSIRTSLFLITKNQETNPHLTTGIRSIADDMWAGTKFTCWRGAHLEWLQTADIRWHAARVYWTRPITSRWYNRPENASDPCIDKKLENLGCSGSCELLVTGLISRFGCRVGWCRWWRWRQRREQWFLSWAAELVRRSDVHPQCRQRLVLHGHVTRKEGSRSGWDHQCNPGLGFLFWWADHHLTRVIKPIKMVITTTTITFSGLSPQIVIWSDLIRCKVVAVTEKPYLFLSALQQLSSVQDIQRGNMCHCVALACKRLLILGNCSGNGEWFW